MESWLIDMGTNHAVLVYLVIMFIGIFEGPAMSIIMGVLLRLGYFSLLPTYIALMTGDLIGDTMWYCLGYYYGHGFVKKFNKWFGVNEEGISKFEGMYHRHKHKILIISKLTTGFGLGIFVLATAGIVRLKYSKFISINFIGQIFWSALLLSAGYLFGHVYSKITSIIGRILITAILIAIIYCVYRYVKKIRNRIIK